MMASKATCRRHGPIEILGGKESVGRGFAIGAGTAETITLITSVQEGLMKVWVKAKF